MKITDPLASTSRSFGNLRILLFPRVEFTGTKVLTFPNLTFTLIRPTELSATYSSCGFSGLKCSPSGLPHCFSPSVVPFQYSSQYYMNDLNNPQSLPHLSKGGFPVLTTVTYDLKSLLRRIILPSARPVYT